MSLELERTSQGSCFFIEAKKSLYTKINEAGQKTGFIRLCAPFVAVSSAMLTIAIRVSLFAESLFKGLVNTIGFPFSGKCDPIEGVIQIFVKFPLHLLSLIFLPFELSCRIIVSTGGLLIFPKDYAASRADSCQNYINKAKNEKSFLTSLAMHH